MSSQNNLLYHTKKLLKKYQILPSKKLGQNFLIDKTAIKKIIAAAELQPQALVLEVGPGTGTITQEIAKRAKKVIAVEKDAAMCKILKETMKEYKNVKIIQGDILKVINNQSSVINNKSSVMTIFNDREILSLINYQDYKVVGNLPFYLTAPVIRKFLELIEVRPQSIPHKAVGVRPRQPHRPKQMVFVVQKEVGQRICAKPGKMSLLAVSVQFFANVKIIAYISKKCFWPQPKVDSAIVKITPLIYPIKCRFAAILPKAKLFNRVNTDKKPINADLFFKIVKAGFSQPRKQLLNTLAKGLNLDKEKIKKWLLKNNIQPEQRPETLSVKQWMLLAGNFKV